MSFTISDTFVTATGPTNGGIVNAYKASRFSSVPTLNSTPPGAPDFGPVTTGTSFGGPGQFQIAVGTNEPYYCSFSYNGQTTWKLYNAANFTDGAQGATALNGNLDGGINRGVNFAAGVAPTDLAVVSQIVPGPQGSQGPQGSPSTVPGPQGTQGAQGPQGFQGTQGYQSAVPGPQGPQGFQGNNGNIGPQGYQGTQGTQGLIGPQGNTGTQGPQGNQGLTGPQGTQGSQGVQGSQGFQGLTGPQGTQGVQGATGSQGFQGNQGFQGSQGLQGSQGTTGATGSQGAQGSQGPQGVQGFQGVQGSTGSQGATGSQGSTGAQGSQGNQGMYIQASSSGVPTTSLWADTSTVGSAVVPVGGLAGQVLNKNTNADYDTGWVNPLFPASGIPAMHGYVAWTNDPAITGSQSTAQQIGVMNHQMIYLQQGQVISYISVAIATSGVGLTNSYLGLYNATSLLATTAAITTAWQSSGVTKNALVTPYTVPSTGFYWVALLVGNGSTTGPRFMGPVVGNGTTAAANAGLAGSASTLTLRYGASGSGLTALPSTISGTPTPSASYVFWAGLN